MRMPEGPDFWVLIAKVIGHVIDILIEVLKSIS